MATPPPTGNLLGSLTGAASSLTGAASATGMSAGAKGSYNVMGQDPITQVLTGCAIVILLYIIMGTGEYAYKCFINMWKDRVELFPDTYPSGSNMFTAIQNPSNPEARTINFSENQRSGIEFSYAMFINIKSATFSNGDAALYHILHKGYSKPYPLMGPGIFCWGNKNTIRIYMNSYDTWDNYTEIDNIPVDKWFHLVLSCKGNVMYIYLNGNLKQKIKMSKNTPPYQNYGNVYLFSSRKQTLTPSGGKVTSLLNDTDFTAVPPATQANLSALTFNGSATGMVSRVYYYGFALSYSEIQTLISEGVSPKLVSDGTSSASQYLADTWWTTNGTVPTMN